MLDLKYLSTQHLIVLVGNVNGMDDLICIEFSKFFLIVCLLSSIITMDVVDRLFGEQNWHQTSLLTDRIYIQYEVFSFHSHGKNLSNNVSTSFSLIGSVRVLCGIASRRGTIMVVRVAVACHVASPGFLRNPNSYGDKLDNLLWHMLLVYKISL